MKKITLISLTLCTGLMASSASFAAVKIYHAPAWHANYVNNQKVDTWWAWKDINAKSNNDLFTWPGQKVQNRGNGRFALVTHAGGAKGPWYGMFRLVKAKSCQSITNGEFRCTTN